MCGNRNTLAERENGILTDFDEDCEICDHDLRNLTLCPETSCDDPLTLACLDGLHYHIEGLIGTLGLKSVLEQSLCSQICFCWGPQTPNGPFDHTNDECCLV